MATTTTQIEQKPRVILPRASRGNEILAILFLALGLLLALCLISAAFYPNDPSWNSAGQTETQNWAAQSARTLLRLLSSSSDSQRTFCHCFCSRRRGGDFTRAAFIVRGLESQDWLCS